MTDKLPQLGFGLGLRTDHYRDVLETRPDLDWFEVLTENYLVPGGKPLSFLDQIAEHYPLVMHGVSMSIGGSDPLDFDYLRQVKQLSERIEAKWISDHLCWTGVGGINAHDLLPLPYSEEAIRHIVARIDQVQHFLGRQILLENVSSYLSYRESVMPEWEFLSEIAHRGDCLILLDVNNVYVSAYNHNFDAETYIKNLPSHRIQQIHLAGHTHCETHIIDTHDAQVANGVWQLSASTIKHLGPISTMIERDDNIPPLSELLEELNIARRITDDVIMQHYADEGKVYDYA